MKGRAPRLALKKRYKATWKWPIGYQSFSRPKGLLSVPSRKVYAILTTVDPFHPATNGPRKSGGINPLSSSIKMHVLLTVLPILLMVLVGRICLNITTFCIW